MNSPSIEKGKIGFPISGELFVSEFNELQGFPEEKKNAGKLQDEENSFWVGLVG
jgi:hypothetical protein